MWCHFLPSHAVVSCGVVKCYGKARKQKLLRSWWSSWDFYFKMALNDTRALSLSWIQSLAPPKLYKSSGKLLNLAFCLQQALAASTDAFVKLVELLLCKGKKAGWSDVEVSYCHNRPDITNPVFWFVFGFAFHAAFWCRSASISSKTLSDEWRCCCSSVAKLQRTFCHFSLWNLCVIHAVLCSLCRACTGAGVNCGHVSL